jgi:Putative Actinobacterial Holin-X, holin superfamily III
MPTQGNSEMGFGQAAKGIAEHASRLASLEMELAGLELKRKVGALGMGIALGVTAAVVLVFALGFGLAAAAAGLATVFATWLALLIVFGGLLLVGLIIGLVAMSAIKSGTPPVPEQAIEEAKLTTDALKGNGAR